MLDSDHTPSAPPAEPVRGVTRGLIVGAYDGLRAGTAIVAVRELGLRPSLERIEGYHESLHGFVISQEPAAGAEAAADSQVFLYIASPARTIPASAPSGGAEEGPEEESDGIARDDAEQELPEDEPDGVEHERPAAAPGTPETWEGEPAEREVRMAGERERPREEPAQAGDDREAVENAPAWRGGPPGAVPRRRLASSSHRNRRSLLGSLPLGVRLAAVGIFACVALTLLLSLASQVRSPSRPRSTVATRPAAPAPAPRAPSPVDAPLPPVDEPLRPVHRPHRRSASRRAVRPPRLVTVAPRSNPSASAASPRAPLTGAAAAEHAAQEFGP